MIHGWNRKQTYLLAVVLMLVSMMLLAAFGPSRIRGGGSQSAEPTPQAEGGQADADPTEAVEATMSTVVYYQDDYGYLVPVTRTIKAEEGVAKATVNLMVKSVFNDMEAARMGLRTVIPEGTKVDLDISGGLARIDLSEEALLCADAAAESNMVSAIVQTLTDFPTVDRVKFLIGGKEVKELPHGTSLKNEFTRGVINPEGGAPEDSKNAVTLYFLNDTPSVIVPVTRAVYGNADLQTAVLELVKGPGGASPLEGVLPSGCGLIGVELKNGVAKINFTESFIRVAEQSDGGRMAMKALVLTCKNFDGVKDVQILVEGKPYDPGEGTLAMPTFVNSATDIAEAFVRRQSDELFDAE